MSKPSPTGDTQRLRSDLRAARRRLSRAEHAAASEQLCANLLGLECLQRPGAVALYTPTDGEIDPGTLVAPLLDQGWRCHLPVLGAGRSMRFALYEPTAELAPNRFGIKEPVGGELIEAGALDVVIVPCVALDPSGHRVGFGAGYYDRALAGASVTKIGVGYEFQVVDELASQPWDVAMDLVVTDRSVRIPTR